MLPDDEKATAWNFELVLPVPVEARYVTYHITPKRILCASELQVLDRIGYDPFDIRIAPPSPFAAPPIEPVNAPPSVTLTSPGAADTFVAPATVAVTAAAQDSDGTIQQVEFFSGSNSIGIATSSPFTVTMSNVPSGQYVLTARATDDAGAQTTSQPWSSPSRRWAMSPSPPLSV